ncbi:MAG: serine protease [Draconibacterium sp.]|nr:MAG: serine protease [Draconibacterium sp.]
MIFALLFSYFFYFQTVKTDTKTPTYLSSVSGNLNTVANANYLNDFEKELILEMNKLRSAPAEYANVYIAPLVNNYNGLILYYPGDKPLKTKEGVKAVHECVRALKSVKPAPLLSPAAGLTKAARDHVKDQSRTGATGHTGSDNSTIRKRVERYGTWKYRIGENIAYGGKTPRQVVIYLLIDDGVYDRGHRTNMLNPEFKTTGVATGFHPLYDVMHVMEYAAAYSDK